MTKQSQRKKSNITTSPLMTILSYYYIRIYVSQILLINKFTLKHVNVFSNSVTLYLILLFPLRDFQNILNSYSMQKKILIGLFVRNFAFVSISNNLLLKQHIYIPVFLVTHYCNIMFVLFE